MAERCGWDGWKGRGTLAAALALAGCIPRATPPPGYGGRGLAVPADDRAARTRAYGTCLADLSRMGARVEPLPDRTFANGCSALSAVKLVAVGVPVTNLGAMTCALAGPFAAWLSQVARPAARARFGVELARVDSLGSFACRPVNGQAGARLSEHGRANAVDIGGFVLAGGRRITVAADWAGPDARARAFLRDLHDGACRRFAVVLGPEANALHHDHLHFDMGSGRLCR